MKTIQNKKPIKVVLEKNVFFKNNTTGCSIIYSL